jgi:hypothetical protein
VPGYPADRCAGERSAPIDRLRIWAFQSGRLRQDPSNATIQYVVEQGGRIKVVQNGTITLFPNISTPVAGASEQGLLGPAFPPNYGSSGRFYI